MAPYNRDMGAQGGFSIAALLRGRCPQCREGVIFGPLLSTRALTMNTACPACGLDFEPGAGYFLGAMYVSYAIGTLTILPVALALIFLLEASLAVTLAVAFAQTLVMMLFMYRASRVFWLHLYQALNPW